MDRLLPFFAPPAARARPRGEEAAGPHPKKGPATQRDCRPTESGGNVGTLAPPHSPRGRAGSPSGKGILPGAASLGQNPWGRNGRCAPAGDRWASEQERLPAGAFRPGMAIGPPNISPLTGGFHRRIIRTRNHQSPPAGRRVPCSRPRSGVCLRPVSGLMLFYNRTWGRSPFRLGRCRTGGNDRSGFWW